MIGDSLAPGLVVTITEDTKGPQATLSARFNSSGVAETSLGNIRVLFDGTAAPLLYVQAQQINAVVPYAVAGRVTSSVQVEFQGVRSDPAMLPVFAAAPGLYTFDGSGRGPGAILNQDSTMNTPTNPADQGSIVTLFGTGGGTTDPLPADGSVIVGKPPGFTQPVTATIDGQAAEVLYAGPVPGQISGLLQANVRVPRGIRSGAVPVFLKVGRFSSQWVTLEVR
jgi:uncharacterized protein (TIGR03437 family)